MSFLFFKEITCSCTVTGNTVGKIFEFYKTAALYSLTFFFFSFSTATFFSPDISSSSAALWLVASFEHELYCIEWISTHTVWECQKVKPDHDPIFVDVNVIILPLRLLDLCALQTFILSGFPCKPQEEEESRCVPVLVSWRHCPSFNGTNPISKKLGCSVKH